MRCDECRYYKKSSGDCRRNPPLYSIDSLFAVYPYNTPDGWCGEFSEIVEDVLMNDSTCDFMVVSNMYAVDKISKALEDGVEYSKKDIVEIVKHELGL